MTKLLFKLVCYLLILMMMGILESSKFPDKEKIYIEKGKNRSFKLRFINDTLCSFTNEFKCKCLDPDIKIINQSCLYRIKGDTIFIKNVLYKENESEPRYLYEIPVQDCAPCWFLNKNSRKRNSNGIGPSYSTDYEKYGRVIKFNIDTLYIFDNHSVYYFKKTPGGSIGAVFK